MNTSLGMYIAKLRKDAPNISKLTGHINYAYLRKGSRTDDQESIGQHGFMYFFRLGLSAFWRFCQEPPSLDGYL